MNGKETITVSSKNEDVELQKKLECQEVLKDIEMHIGRQPQSVRDMLPGMKDNFYSTTEIQGKKFIFTKLNGGETLALVRSESDVHVYKTRVFRFSSSDHQWKSLPGQRKNGSYMKGDEKNPLHHYVQSAKLHKDVYRAISELPQEGYHYSATRYLPSEKVVPGFESYAEEFEFKERYQTLRNKEWASYQVFCQRLFKVYEKFVLGMDSFKDFTLQGSLYVAVLNLANIPEFKKIKDELERLNSDPQFSKKMEKNWIGDTSEIGSFMEVYKTNVGSFIEKCFKTNFPSTLSPDFSESSRIDSYEKPDLVEKNGDDTIHIEEYRVSNTDGDELVFAMAYDGKGRVYIDNIYDPRVGITDYGIPKEIVHMGHLVYKPEDYETQTYAIPEQYKSVADTGYITISDLWENIPVIKTFKEELKKRGTLI